MRKLALGVVTLTLGVLPTEGRGQSLTAELIPRELVEALVMPSLNALSFLQGTPSRPIISVGTLPEPLAQRVTLPAGARILGGISSSAASTGYAIVALSPDSIRAFYRQEMVKKGWREPTPMSRQFPSWGFVDTLRYAMIDENQGLSFCQGSDGVVVTLEPTGPGTQRLQLTTGAIAQMLCASRNAPQNPVIRETWRREVRLYQPSVPGPDLCPSYSSSGGGQQGSITSPLTNEQLLDHYTRQLIDSGWKAVDLPVAARRFTKTDSTVERIVEVGVRTPPNAPGCRESYTTTWEIRRR